MRFPNPYLGCHRAEDQGRQDKLGIALAKLSEKIDVASTHDTETAQTIISGMASCTSRYRRAHAAEFKVDATSAPAGGVP